MAGLTFEASIAIQSLLAFICLCLLCARFYLRFRIQKKMLEVSDYFIFFAWVFSLPNSALDVVFFCLGVPSNTLLTFSNYETSPEVFLLISKYFWASNFPYFTGFYLCKGAILAFYCRLFPYHFRAMRYALWGVIGYSITGYLITIFANLLACLPIDRNWSLNPDDFCDKGSLVFRLAWVFHFSSDIMIFVLPFHILRCMQVKKIVKVGLYFTFGLGIINISVCLARFLVIQVGLETLTIAVIDLLSAIDLYVGITIACLPVLRPYLRIMHPDSTPTSITYPSSSARAWTDLSWRIQRQRRLTNLLPIPPATDMMSLGSTLALEDNAASYSCELETLERPQRPLFGTHNRLSSDEELGTGE